MKLRATKKSIEETSMNAAPPKDPVSFDDFAKLDIRTATILEAEKVPKTTKLLKLKIDTGIDIRTIVSGIAEYYEPESIIGKQISIIANLEPRKIKGIESKGMILMAEDSDGKFVMVSPVEKVSNGSVIK
jgi:methionyl-tRNA synthetase